LAAQQLVANASTELNRAQAKLADTESATRAVTAVAETAELAAIAQAQHQWTMAQLRWRGEMVELARWKLADAQAVRELAIAELLYRRGAEVDVAPFRGQQARLHERVSQEIELVARLHAALDVCARTLAEAKERYAATRRPPAALATSARDPR
jgi:hypothetical protein